MLNHTEDKNRISLQWCNSSEYYSGLSDCCICLACDWRRGESQRTRMQQSQKPKETLKKPLIKAKLISSALLDFQRPWTHFCNEHWTHALRKCLEFQIFFLLELVMINHRKGVWRRWFGNMIGFGYFFIVTTNEDFFHSLRLQLKAPALPISSSVRPPCTAFPNCGFATRTLTVQTDQMRPIVVSCEKPTARKHTTLLIFN